MLFVDDLRELSQHIIHSIILPKSIHHLNNKQDGMYELSTGLNNKFNKIQLITIR